MDNYRHIKPDSSQLDTEKTYGIDYEEMYSSVRSMNSIRVLLSVCCQEDFLVHQCDVKTAFLDGYLEGEGFNYPPRGVGWKEKRIRSANSTGVCTD